MLPTHTAHSFPLKKQSRCLAISLVLAFSPALVLAQQKAAAPVAASAPAGAAASAPAAAAAVDTLSTVGQLSSIPAPELAAKAWLSIDANSGQVITAQNGNEKIEPASLTKIMSAYVIFQAIENKRLSLDQKVNISEKAWKTEGSRMFAKVNTQVSVDDLLQGVIVQSGNDATVALAEAVAGSESAFAALMNQEAAKMGLTHTHFANATGLPDPEHYTTVYDLGIMAMRLAKDFPQYFHYYSQKEFTYNKIKQHNRNRLLWTDPTVDGMKTGHTSEAGYCLVATALRDGRRVVTVLVGAASDSARAENSLKLLNWSFQNFDTIKVLDGAKPLVQARVWQGQADTVGLGQPSTVWLTVPRGKGPDVKPEARYTQPLIAPLTKGAKVGTVVFTLDGKQLRQEPLLVLNDVAQAGIFGRLVDKVRLMFQ
ncbi:MAG TPA: D-alanyl-D-alanine carboxypeptidase family protein [Eoetvoesiella sp.]|uniref:D-alanyl-D-alanine carboxypeptidase family protein n=1 Tax=Eoetvoesiella sp. TaxID=1966355 RepID=UPI002D1313D5|nr:D-alanyl-D-alanine carboxypeptidase family protein [Eoetvoesiella sp.]HWK61465.1 D-alanyl-D-alanine carboxypeptidase family protein [Eoetvoesiella sp.]